MLFACSGCNSRISAFSTVPAAGHQLRHGVTTVGGSVLCLNGMQVINLFNVTARNFPDADIQVSTLDAYFELLLAEVPQLQLPVVTGEIGDTWIYGVHRMQSHAPDALKLSDDMDQVLGVPHWQEPTFRRLPQIDVRSRLDKGC